MVGVCNSSNYRLICRLNLRFLQVYYYKTTACVPYVLRLNLRKTVISAGFAVTTKLLCLLCTNSELLLVKAHATNGCILFALCFRQLPNEWKLFVQVDKSWKDIMRRTEDRPNALRAATAHGTLEVLQLANTNLEKIQKCLEVSSPRP